LHVTCCDQVNQKENHNECDFRVHCVVSFEHDAINKNWSNTERPRGLRPEPATGEVQCRD
jgi:hypothetical protein